MRRRLAAACVAVVLVIVPSAIAFASYTWTSVASIDQPWRAMAVSDNGSIAYSSKTDFSAPFEAHLWKTIDGGGTWSELLTSPNKRMWTRIAMSVNGAKIVAIGYRNDSYAEYLAVSADGGTNWSQKASQLEWFDVAMSSNGSVLFAVNKSVETAAGGVWKSDDAGDTWTDVTPFNGATKTIGPWRSVAVSSDGTKVLAARDSSSLYLSTDSGTSWTAVQSVASGMWSGAEMSGNGQLMLATVDDGNEADNGAWVSRDSGVTWSRTLALSALVDAAVSRDGSTMAVARYPRDSDPSAVYVSRDGGATWVAEPAPAGSWTGLGLSAGGERMLVAAEFGFMQVATSTTTTTTTTTTTAPPTSASQTSSSTAASTTSAAATSSSAVASASTTTTSVVDAPAPAVTPSMIDNFASKSLVKESTSIAPGETVTIRISGFQPFELVSIGVESTGAVQSQASSGRRVLVTVRADATGTIEVRTKLPMSVSGEATLWAYGRESKRGFRQTLSVGVLPGTGARRVTDGIVEGTFLVLAGAAVFALRRRLHPQ